MSDDRGRPASATTCASGPSPATPGSFHVGRLDVDTEGLLLLTNDGELAHRLMHPSYEVLKTYLAEVPGPVPKDVGKRLKAGIVLDDGPIKVDAFRLVDSMPGKALVELVLHEGRKHIVRRLLDEVGYPCQRWSAPTSPMSSWATSAPARCGGSRKGRGRHALPQRRALTLFGGVRVAKPRLSPHGGDEAVECVVARAAVLRGHPAWVTIAGSQPWPRSHAGARSPRPPRHRRVIDSPPGVASAWETRPSGAWAVPCSNAT